jgi:hypothetical protein
MPSPPEKEAPDSIGSPPSGRPHVRALYSFSRPIPSAALNFDVARTLRSEQQLLKHLKVDLYEFVK